MGDRTDLFERVLQLEPGRTALLVVDMQRGFLDPGQAMEVPEARAIVSTVADLLALFRRKGLPVAFTQASATGFCTAMPPPIVHFSMLQSILPKLGWWSSALYSVFTAGKIFTL